MTDITRKCSFSPKSLTRWRCVDFCNFLKEELKDAEWKGDSEILHERYPTVSFTKKYEDGKVQTNIYFFGESFNNFDDLNYFTEMHLKSTAKSDEMKELVNRLHSDIAENYPEFFNRILY